LRKRDIDYGLDNIIPGLFGFAPNPTFFWRHRLFEIALKDLELPTPLPLLKIPKIPMTTINSMRVKPDALATSIRGRAVVLAGLDFPKKGK